MSRTYVKMSFGWWSPCGTAKQDLSQENDFWKSSSRICSCHWCKISFPSIIYDPCQLHWFMQCRYVGSFHNHLDCDHQHDALHLKTHKRYFLRDSALDQSLLCFTNLSGSHLAELAWWSKIQADPWPDMRTGEGPFQTPDNGSFHMTFAYIDLESACQKPSAADISSLSTFKKIQNEKRMVKCFEIFFGSTIPSF